MHHPRRRTHSVLVHNAVVRRLLLVLAVSLTALTPGTVSAADWPTYHGDNTRQGNDSLDLGDSLGKLLHGRLAHVNLIPYNPIPGDPYQATLPAQVEAFKRRIKSQGVECTVRDTRGRNIDAACGQLRAEAEAILTPT